MVVTKELPEGDPEEETEQPEEEEEEVDLIDPLDGIKEECREETACAPYKTRLDVCTERVEGTPDTEETCAEELYDFIHCVDKCVAKQIFKHLK